MHCNYYSNHLIILLPIVLHGDLSFGKAKQELGMDRWVSYAATGRTASQQPAPLYPQEQGKQHSLLLLTCPST